MTKRRSFTKLQRAKIFDRHGGICHMCGLKIFVPKEPWDVSHEIPLAAGGKDDETNWKPAHRTCHRDHTAEVDAPLIAKVRRQWANNISGKSEPKMRSARFRKASPQRKASTPLNKWAAWRQ